MRLNVSAWAIRKPLPSIVLFIVLTILYQISVISTDWPSRAGRWT